VERGQLGEGRRAPLGRGRLSRLALIGAAVAVLTFPGAAAAVERISSPFLLEYSSPSYVIDQGEIVVFENRDPFLLHGLVSDEAPHGVPLFSAPVLSRGQSRLVRGAPFLSGSGGSFAFRDPAYPGMTAELVVGPGGAPLPPDLVPPSAGVKIRAPRLDKLARSGVLRVVLAPSEAVDAALVVKARGRRLGRAERTYVAAGRYGLRLKLAKRPLRRRSSTRLRVVLQLTDAAGNLTITKATRRLTGGSRGRDRG
jgi:hypothetical protein